MNDKKINKTINFVTITDPELWENTSIAAGVEGKSEKGAGAERGDEVERDKRARTI